MLHPYAALAPPGCTGPRRPYTGRCSEGKLVELLRRATERDKALKSLDAKLATPVVLPNREVLKAALEFRKDEWRDLLRGPHVAQSASSCNT